MEQKELSALTDQELLQAAKKIKNARLINAALIGFLIGIVVYSVSKNTWGLLTLIPLYLAYKLLNKPPYNTQELDHLIKERNLK